MALDCPCPKCNGQEITEDNFFEPCLNLESELQLRALKAEQSIFSGSNVFFTVLIVLLFIFGIAAI